MQRNEKKWDGYDGLVAGFHGLINGVGGGCEKGTSDGCASETTGG